MDVKSNVKRRREERIKQLIIGEAGVPAATSPFAKRNSYEAADFNHIIEEQRIEEFRRNPKGADEREQDPEWMWKHGQGRWKDSDLFGGQMPPMLPDEGKRSSFWSMLFIRLSISVLLFIGIWAINRYEPPWSGSIRLFVAHSLTHEMDFGAAEAWYKRNFGGAPTFIPIFKQNEDHGVKVNHSSSFTVPLEGKIAGAFALSLKGVNIVPASDSNTGLQVKSVETGRVLSVSNDAFTGQTVTVQHANGYASIYGHLHQAFVEKGDWVESGDLIGKLEAPFEQGLPTLYFALQKDERYIDPADVIPFD
ncbi:M23 family metallopeptidase [Paenibacillus bouchesdurhonensis]|uniref:M23 family metallopeptidase n=1 Tax=Paenibacillus bouchesdurhonensis TaxID=1870990 RepID=UPI000DA60756|nr:M23 family metallopeptidase [Paenibacillus bouchesdurhonensis]